MPKNLFDLLSTLFDRTEVCSEFPLQDSLPAVEGSPKLKVVLIGGQSNASGSSWVRCLKDRIPAEDFERYQKGFPEIPIFYFCDNGDNHSDGKFVPVALGQGGDPERFGPEVGLAEYLSEHSTDRYALIKYAWGGSDLYSKWLSPYSPDRIRNRTGKLYLSFVRFVKTGMDYLRKKGFDAEIEALCWMQGEADGVKPRHYDKYLAHTEEFIRGIRRDLAPYASGNGIRFVDAAISDGRPHLHYSAVNAAKRVYSEGDENAIYIDTIAAGLSTREEPTKDADLAHYDSLSEIELGRLFGEAVRKAL